jgi:hypothetical protein
MADGVCDCMYKDGSGPCQGVSVARWEVWWVRDPDAEDGPVGDWEACQKHDGRMRELQAKWAAEDNPLLELRRVSLREEDGDG